MDKKALIRLKEEKEKRTNALIQDLSKDNRLEEAKKNMEWIKLFTQLMNSLPSHNSFNWLWPLIIGTVCLLIIGLAWTQHRQEIQVSFEVVSPNISLKLSEDWKLTNSFRTSNVYIDNLDTVLAPNLEIRFKRVNMNDQGTATLSLTGNNIKLTDLEIGKGAKLDLEMNRDKLTFFVKEKEFNGKLEAENGYFVLTKEDDNESKKKLEDFETIQFKSSETRADYVKIELVMVNTPWKIRDFSTSTLSFSEEYPPGSGNFESTIKSGNINLPETGDTEDLREGDVLLLKDIVARRLELSRAEAGIKVFFEGTVSAISIGPSEFERNIAPTYLEYFYHHQKIGFFWSAIVFLWGLLWSIKNSIFKK
ncbi:MAG: hypothetical protein GY775_16130 [Candidatus Scalindua sp.]|nr:hypothetical protein [Candidatus Scalindua sp.]